MPAGEPEIEVVQHHVTVASVPRQEKRRSHWALNMLGIGMVLLLCYYGQVVLTVMLVSVLLAFVLAPVVDLLGRMRVPRGLGAAIAILLLFGALGGIADFSYNQAAIFLQTLPRYSAKLRDDIMRFRKQTESLQALAPQQDGTVINVRPATDWTDILTRGFGSLGQTLVAASFVPFLAYFMLTWQQHVRSSTVMLFPMESRNTAYVTLGLISGMIRSFMVGNILIGLLLGTVSTMIFWTFHLPFFYFIGFLSGFLSLVPYMGILLAMAPPLFVGLGHVETEDLVSLIIVVLGLHLFAMNVLYPKFLGKRLRLNPLAVTMSLLVWAWLWGAVGLLLAIPITAAMKIVFDHIESLRPYAAWLGE